MIARHGCRSKRGSMGWTKTKGLRVSRPCFVKINLGQIETNIFPIAHGGFDMLVYCHNHDEWEHSKKKLEEWLLNGAKVSNGVNGH